jgi:raffinose/stachyose/melibiose transport system permease protein
MRWRSDFWVSGLQYLILGLWGLIVLIPLLNLLMLSLKSLPGIVARPFSLPSTLHFSNYVNAWKLGDLGIYLFNTAWMSVLAVAVVLGLGSLAGYVLGRFDFKGNRFLYLVFLAGLALPIQMIAVPYFGMMEALNLINSPWSLVLLYGASGLSFSVFILTAFARNLPTELEEAAWVEGATPTYVYWRIALPLMRPILASVGLFNFVSAWNGFFFPLILLTSRHNMTITVGILSFIGEHLTEWQYLLPALVISMLPPILVFLIVSRQFIRGLTSGALKI